MNNDMTAAATKVHSYSADYTAGGRFVTATESLKERALRAADALPAVPGVLQSALGLFVRRDDLSVAQLAAKIERDVVITGTILAISNSAFYGGYNRVSSVRQAIARVGINKTRNVLLGLSVIRSMRRVKLSAPWSLTRFNAHSLAAAILCDLIVQHVPTVDPEWAFLAGLLHDIGLLVIAFGLPDQLGAIANYPGADLIEQELAVLGFTHFEVGADMISRWNCPAAVQKATLFNEFPGFGFKKPLSLGAVVTTATLIADSQGISIFEPHVDRTLAVQLLEALDIASPDRFMAEFQSAHRELQAITA
jgi:HD-like signal output (HDOD) protein